MDLIDLFTGRVIEGDRLLCLTRAGGAADFYAAYPPSGDTFRCRYMLTECVEAVLPRNVQRRRKKLTSRLTA